MTFKQQPKLLDRVRKPCGLNIMPAQSYLNHKIVKGNLKQKWGWLEHIGRFPGHNETSWLQCAGAGQRGRAERIKQRAVV